MASPGRPKPKGASSGRRINLPSRRQELSEGSRPRNRGLSGRPVASAAGTPAGETVSGSIRAAIPPGTFREVKAPKGESHERCRCETKPARDRRAQAVKRVTKPRRRNVAGGRACVSGPSILHVLKGAEAQERSWLAAAGRLGRVRCDSRRRRNSREGSTGDLTVASEVSRKKTTQPRERPTAKWDRLTNAGGIA